MIKSKKDTTLQESEILKKAIKVFGLKSQLGILQEECAEVIQAVSKYNRVKDTGDSEKLAKVWSKLVFEIVDVEIMIEQMKSLIDPKDFKAKKRSKILRLEKRIKKVQAEKTKKLKSK